MRAVSPYVTVPQTVLLEREQSEEIDIVTSAHATALKEIDDTLTEKTAEVCLTRLPACLLACLPACLPAKAHTHNIVDQCVQSFVICDQEKQVCVDFEELQAQYDDAMQV
jgi:hypothetical protein